MLAEVLCLLQEEGALLPSQVARRLGISDDEAEAALGGLLAAGMVDWTGPVAGCPGRCESCSSSRICAWAVPIRGNRA